MSTCVASPSAQTGQKKEESVALLIESSEGVRIMRNGQAFSAKVGHVLKLGDRVIVREGASARAVFQKQGGQVVQGIFHSQSDASLVYFSQKKGSCSVVFDVTAGKVELSLAPFGEDFQDTQSAQRSKRTAVGFHCYSKPIA